MSLEHLEALIRKSPYPWWEWEVRTDRLVFSPLKVTALGYSVTEFVDRGFRAFTSLIHAEDYDRTMDAMRRVLYEGVELYQVDYRIRDCEGRFHWYMDRGLVIQRDERGPVAIRGIVIDLGREGELAGGPENAYLIVSSSLLTTPAPKSFITVCASCKRVKAREKTYVVITEDLLGVLAEEVSHSVCPDCMRRLYPELEALNRRRPEAPPGTNPVSG